MNDPTPDCERCSPHVLPEAWAPGSLSPGFKSSSNRACQVTLTKPQASGSKKHGRGIAHLLKARAEKVGLSHHLVDAPEWQTLPAFKLREEERLARGGGPARSPAPPRRTAGRCRFKDALRVPAVGGEDEAWRGCSL
ncbi:hypothetical protein J1605_000733 [Eschrichtius robustus]|uniref:Uncharacterized protein n=1 Tax=Eschrichtius robustus TaxID=9764 RepID=A0AB34GQF7_ESCRO|nr:hypothetical protein J1605_000733 [Eschrichtius robustus]